MRKVILAAAILAAFPAWAQKPKSKSESEALQAVQSAATADDRLKAIDNVLTKFADTEYKGVLLTMALQTAQQKGDFAQTTFYAEQILEGDPKNAIAQVTVAFETARRTREFDLDKDEKLAKAEKYADQALANAPGMPKPQSNVTDADWDGRKKDVISQAHEAKGMIATLRKKRDVAIEEYKAASEVSSTPDPATFVRLGQAYMDGGRYDDAIANFDKAIAMPTAVAVVKQVAEQKKAEAVKKKAAAAPPAPK
jgi:tetratricopeptide (TPR) repeat protein